MSLPELDHAHYLRLTFDLAKKTAESGAHPFASVLVDGKGEVILEQGNAYMPDHDMTGHAERVLSTRASLKFRPAELADMTLYTNAEPCAMCAGAIYWTGIGRVVFGMTEKQLKDLTGNHPENPTLDLPCHIVFESGQRKVEVVGPMLEEEAAQIHLDFWKAR